MRWTRRQLLGAAPFAALPLPAWQSYYTGRDQPPGEQIELAAGPMTMIFEPSLAFLRSLRFGETEVIRGLYAAVRDRNWGTVTPRVRNLQLEKSAGGFRLRFDVECNQSPIHFSWRGLITGDASSRVRFHMEGEARSTFLRNRIGFCVLHPIKECAGRYCTVIHGNGAKEIGKFPQFVSPDQPFLDMVSISHEAAPGVTAEVAFEGETFEMEDQRNWTDASYKTYCTPLAKPFPVEVKQGTRIAQSVTVALRGASSPPKRFFVRRKELTLEVDSAGAKPLPKIGLGLGLHLLDAKSLHRLNALQPAHLRVDWKAGDGIPQLHTPLEIAVHLSANAEEDLKAVASAAGKSKVARWIIYHHAEKSTSAKWVTLARQHLRGAPVGGGTDAFFAELNRGRPQMAGLDFLCYSINPQVHAFDDSSLVENLAGQAETVQSARQFSAGKPVAVTPVTFKPRFNPNATGAAAAPDPDQLPPQVDPRQLSLFGAAWTLGSVKHLAESGAQSITFFETVGPLGVMESPSGSRWPKLFPSTPGQVYPLYHVLSDVNEFAGGEILPVRAGHPLLAEGLLLRKGGRVRLITANFTPEAQVVRFLWPGAAKRIVLRRLDESSVKRATESPEAFRAQPAEGLVPAGGAVELALAPYATVTLDSGA
ncbi:MAG: hypothetical protein LC126_27950 [Bryobacterales bacterium]|nr:hypothetical protein [Bryobacterales bacterium]